MRGEPNPAFENLVTAKNVRNILAFRHSFFDDSHPECGLQQSIRCGAYRI